MAIKTLVALVFAWKAAAVSSDNAAAYGLSINTTSGIVNGFINQTAPNVRQFLGVPYAQPPIGDLRFEPPQDKQSNGTVNATAFAPSCMQQFSINSSTIYTTYLNQFLINGGNSEDCLYLSIWAPKVDSISTLERPLPVFVYFPGGGYTSGGQNSLYKIPDQWIERAQSHIVISINYRVNVFGFPNAQGLSDQNLGLLDQRKAVEWTQANIGNFGGDPSRIIIWGQSAGSGSVSIYPYAWAENPIVAGIIGDSGGSDISLSKDASHSNFTFLAGLVGCSGLNGTAELSCVRSVPAQTLENALSYYSGNGTKPSISFSPVPDNKVVWSNFTAQAAQGKIAKVPMITGSNTNEGAGFVSFTPDGPGAAALFNLTESIIACPTAQNVKDRNLAGVPTYRYQYGGNFSNVSPLPWFGAYHSSELPLIFGTHYEYRSPSTDFEWQVSYALEALWLSFAEDPTRGPARLSPSALIGGPSDNPNNATYFAWPAFTQGSTNMLLVAQNNTLFQLSTSDSIDDYCTDL